MLNLKIFEENVITQNEMDIFSRIMLIWNFKGGSNFGLSASLTKFSEWTFTQIQKISSLLLENSFNFAKREKLVLLLNLSLASYSQT